MPTQPDSSRSIALDVFRGLTMAGMILVSNPGGPLNYAPLEHAAWNGWTPTDLVFPSFAFILGVALTFSLASRRARTEWQGLSLFDWLVPILLVAKFGQMLAGQTAGFTHPPVPSIGGYNFFFAAMAVLLVLLPQLERRAVKHGGSLVLQVIHRGFVLFALGFVWDFDATNPAGFRVLGVLQRLGIVYLVAGLIVLNTRRAVQAAWAGGLLAIYWVLMKSVPVPGHGAGVLTMEGNLAGYVDRLILGRAHMYEPRPLPYWDPEGILGSIPAVATGLLGALAGGWMREEHPAMQKIGRLLLAGIVLLVVGLSLNPWFPINKNLWSPSFVLVTGGFDFILLGACIWVVDFKLVRRPFLPFIVLGSNSILIYVLSGTFMHYAGEISGGTMNGVAISAKDAAYQYGFAWWLSPQNASLGMALAYVALWMAIAGVLYHRRKFIKI